LISDGRPIATIPAGEGIATFPERAFTMIASVVYGAVPGLPEKKPSGSLKIKDRHLPSRLPPAG
jgi:hypothetical protein